jgi:hypothetical protein
MDTAQKHSGTELLSSNSLRLPLRGDLVSLTTPMEMNHVSAQRQVENGVIVNVLMQRDFSSVRQDNLPL